MVYQANAIVPQTTLPRSSSQTLPSPNGGWNRRDSLDVMPPTDSVLMINWFPATNWVETRRGSADHATGMSSDVETLAVLNRAGVEKMIAAANGNIWDVSAAGVATSLKSGFTNNRWQFDQFDTGAGAFLVLCNGYDTPQTYDGTTVSNASFSGIATPANLIGVRAFKNRMFYWERADASGAKSSSFWYSNLNTATATLTEFPLGRLQGVDGNIVNIETWTFDGGAGVDDYAAFMFSDGTLVLYKGTDPSSASNWALAGVYRLGRPLGGPRCFIKLAGDLVAITDQGYMPLSRTLSLALSSPAGAISDKINQELNNVARLYGNNFGWQAILYPKGNRVLFNVPTASPGVFYQHVVNTINGSWCQFQGYNARCFAIYNGDLYFGDSAKVIKADTGFSDNGSAITCTAQSAYYYLGDNRENLKVIKAIRPIFATTESSVTTRIAVSYDFSAPSNFATQTITASSSATWDTATWDVDSWADEQVIVDRNLGFSGEGRNVSISFNVDISTGQIFWYNTAFIFEVGGLT